MSNIINSTIQDLVIFYVTENYKKYLIAHEIERISEDQLENVISKMYNEKKSHLRGFIKQSLKEVTKEDYPGDTYVDGVCNQMYLDDKLCINRLVIEIKKVQKK